MRQFALKVDGKTCYCDTDGRVLDSANPIGTWTTTADNKIRVTRQAGGASEVAVKWKFNDQNQLVLSQGNDAVFTLNTTAVDFPGYRLEKNVLFVDPDGDHDFEFPLSCRWGMDPSGNLKLWIGGVESTLDGYLEDSRSRFRFRFYDKLLPSSPASLVFTGAWERIQDTAADDKSIRLHFKLADPSLENPAAPLNLPTAVKVDPARNHLALVYQSDSYGERRLEFLGTVQIKPNWTVSFSIADSTDGNVRKSRIDVQTTFDWDHAQGELSLYVGREKGPGSQTIEFGGALQAELNDEFSVAWTFAYRNSTAGGQAQMTIASSATFKWKSGGEIWIEYKQAGKTRSIDITGKLVETDFVLSGGVEIVDDPSQRRIGAFLGVSF